MLRPHLLAAACCAAALSGFAPQVRAEIAIANGQPIYFAKDQGAFIVNGRRQGWSYTDISQGQIVGGKPLYRAAREGRACIARGWKELTCRDHIDSFGVQGQHAVYTFTKPRDPDQKMAFVGLDGSQFESGFSQIKHATHIEGTPLYAARLDSGKWAVVKAKKAGPTYDDIVQLKVADGKPLYVAKRSGKTFVTHGTRVFGPYEMVERVEVKNHLPLFTARKAKKRWFLTYGDAHWGPFSQGPHSYMIADGRVLLAARDAKDNRDVIMHGKKELSRCLATQFLQYVDGKPLYTCYEIGGTFAVYGGRRYGPYSGVTDLQVVDGKPLFKAGYLHATAIQHGDSATKTQGVTSTHEQVFYASGRPLYIMSRNDKKYRHVVFGKYVSRFFDGIDASSLTLHGDKPVFAAWRGDNRYVVHGQEEHGPYEGILGDIRIIDGKLLYAVKKLGKEHVVFGAKTEGPYDRVWELSVNQGRLLYFAKKDCREFVVYGGVAGKKYRSVASQLPEPRIALMNRKCSK